MRKAIICSFFAILVMANTLPTPSYKIDKDTALWDLLILLGQTPPNHLPDTTLEGYSVEAGRDIVLHGKGRDAQGKRIKLQSKHFVCTSCHNLVREDPDLRNPNPEARLEYAVRHNIPFLQGTTLYGVVNRSSFYNDDYKKKYGELVDPARHNLREAIQLCAKECSQGRRLKAAELESVLGYLWTLQLKVGDLALPSSIFSEVEKAISEKEIHAGLINKIKQYYPDKSPAHFIDPPMDRNTGDGLRGNAEIGAQIYELSCLHCHANERYSFFHLDKRKLTFCFLKKHLNKYDERSVYQVVRYGAPPKPGKQAYMPQYPKERLSRQQMEDLKAYILQETE